jgi:hypothetical protein
LEAIRRELQEADGDLRGRVEFAMWLRSRAPGPTADLVGFVSDDPGDPSEYWRPPREHPYLKGTLSWAREYRRAREDTGATRGLFVLGELSEELGTARSKLAARIQETAYKIDRDAPKDVRPEFSALTSDIGLHMFVVPPRSRTEGRAAAEQRRPPARETGEPSVLCTICDLDTDRIADESYHAPTRITEVCVKGENEGIFYNCAHHDPGAQDEALFLERLERFDVFGR